MRLCLDVTSIGTPKERWTGVARMSWALSRAIAEKEGIKVSFSAVGTVAAQKAAKGYLSDEFASHRFLGREPGLVTDSLLKASRLKHPINQIAQISLRGVQYFRTPLTNSELRDIDFYFSFYARLPRQLRNHAKIKRGIFIHDLIPLLLPQYCTAQQTGALRRILKSIDDNDLIVVNSNCTKRDFVDRSGAEPDNVHVVPLAADSDIFYPNTDPADISRVRKKYALPEGPYYLSLHSASAHKNMSMLIRAYAVYKQKLGSGAIPLVIAGGKGDPIRQILEFDQLEPSQLDGVIFLGFIDDADLSALYSIASVFFFPSLYEGFGLPLLEALFCGVPVVSSDRASLPEVIAPLNEHRRSTTMLLPADEIDAWATAFENAISLRRLNNKEVLDLTSHYSWSRAAHQLSSLFRGNNL